MLFRRRALMAALLSVAFMAQPLGVLATTGGLGHATPRTTIAYDAPATPPERIPVREPLRVRPSIVPIPAHPAVVQGIRPPGGRRVQGPPLLRPDQLTDIIRKAQLRRAEPVNVRPLPIATVNPVPGHRTAGLARSPVTTPTRTLQSLPGNPTGSGTGINPWWRYQEQNVPGAGHIMVNVGSGNMVLQDDDMSVPHKGIAMSFRRTYNSQSLHDVNGDDGALPGMYGNGWTSTFDAHLTGSNGTINVWDIDGAEYVYTLAADGVTWQSQTAGQHATLTSDGSCGILWTKKSGTTYYFWDPYQMSSCNISFVTYGGYAGRLADIIGRNSNILLSLAYTWDGVTTSAGKINEIVVSTESGMSASLTFTDVNGHRLLAQLKYPDGSTTVTYGYDSSGNLIQVTPPANNSSGTRPTYTYGYGSVGSGTVMSYATSPRYYNACLTSCGTDGEVLYFGFTGTNTASSTLASIVHYGMVNPTISDGINSSTLQSGYSTAAFAYSTEYYTTGVTAPTYRDTDGHMTNWVFDTSGRPKQTQECTVSLNQGQQCLDTLHWLTTTETWDSNNNLTETSDARGNKTDTAYDLNGNAIAVGAPQTTTSQGTFRPTTLYDYDAFNNVTAFCDQTETHAARADWTTAPAPSDTLCSSHNGARAKFTFTYPSYEPYGELATMATPLGYTRRVAYATAQQGGTDYGLPTSVIGDSFTQLDNSTITPTQTFWYDAPGNLRCYSKGVGTYVLSYDSLGRMTSEADPDDTSANSGSLCSKATGQSGWNTQTSYTYFADGTKSGEQSPAERAYSVSTAYTYDLDGNVTSESAHHGCVVGTTCAVDTTKKWYDGADRLVEVAQPNTSLIDAWNLRYLYDLSAGGAVTLNGLSSGFSAYGNLFKTQNLISGQWVDQRGTAFDALDRSVKSFSYKVVDTTQGVGTPIVETTQQLYDAGSPATLGLLTQKTNPNLESVTYTYDPLARISLETYAGENGVTPSETYLYDPNGRKSSVTSGAYGAQQYVYDVDGRLQQSIEPSGGGLTGAGQLTYSYYGNGRQSAVSVSSAKLTQSNILAYSYRADGDLQTQTVNSSFGSGTWSKAYTDAGRLRTVAGIDTQNMSYDATGQLATKAIAAGTLSFTHDPEGSVESTTVPNVSFAGVGAPTTETLTSTLNERGEIVAEQWIPSPDNLIMPEIASSAAGYYNMTTATLPGDGPPPSCEDGADYVNGLHVYDSCPGSPLSPNGDPSSVGDSWTFDATGRLGTHVNTSVRASNITSPSGGTKYIAQQTVKTTTNTYNAENRLLSAHEVDALNTYTNGAPNPVTKDLGATTVGWGPNDHPALLQFGNGTMPPLTLHWDGDMVLFATDGSGNVVDFNVGLDAEAVPTDPTFGGLTTYDRDPSGTIIAMNNSTGTSGFEPKDPTLAQVIGTVPPATWKQAKTPYIQYQRSDGFQLVIFGTTTVQINGVRAYDASLGAWTTPDAYQGDVHDPASQQRYMFNRGNAYDYSDPSGYNPGVLVLGGLVIDGAAAAAAAVGGAAGAALIVFMAATTAPAGDPSDGKELPKVLVGKNAKPSSGKRVNTSAPPGKTPEEVFGDVGGGTGTRTLPDGTKLAPNGTRLRPATPDKGARVEIPANGTKPHEGVHWPDPPKPQPAKPN